MLTLLKQSCASFLFASVTITRGPHSRFTMRSALTDAPATSFTTQPLRATQHVTGLIVKVALLLPSRDLLSSQRQLRWTHTLVLPIVGLNNVTSAAVILLYFSSKLDEQSQALVLIIYL